MTVTVNRPTSRSTEPRPRLTVDSESATGPTTTQTPETVQERRAGRRARKPWVSTVDEAAPAPAPVSLPRAPFLILVLALVIVGVLGVLVLNTKITEGSFQIDDLNETQNSLNLQQQELERQIAEKEAPGNLDQEAARLGLVPAGQPGFINPDGSVVGTPHPADGR